jgi:hypothetical protein
MENQIPIRPAYKLYMKSYTCRRALTTYPILCTILCTIPFMISRQRVLDFDYPSNTNYNRLSGKIHQKLNCHSHLGIVRKIVPQCILFRREFSAVTQEPVRGHRLLPYHWSHLYPRGHRGRRIQRIQGH